MLEIATPPLLWGADHWSLLIYVESCAVDASHPGQPGLAYLDYVRMRINPATHPLCACSARGARRWEPEWGTRLLDGVQLQDHDDIDVLDDLASKQLVEIQSLVNALVVLTSYGVEVAARIRAHKIAGGSLQTFTLAEPAQRAGAATIMGSKEPTVSLSPPAKTIWLVSQKGARTAHLAMAGPGVKQPLCGRHIVLAIECLAPKVGSCKACVRAYKNRRPPGFPT